MRRSIAALLLAGIAGPASAILPPGLTREEAACQRAFGPATDVFGAAIATCVVRCDAKAGGGLPPSACAPPYGAPTRACIERARRAQTRRIARGCRADCPECYGGDCATFGHDALLVTEQVVNGLVERVLCDDASSVDGLSRVEDRCRRVTGMVLARAARAFGTCYVRCRKGTEGSRNGPVGICTAPAGSLQIRSVAACVARVRRLARGAIARACADPPDCLDPTALLDVVAEQIRSDYDALIFCASPSGAFVRG